MKKTDYKRRLAFFYLKSKSSKKKGHKSKLDTEKKTIDIVRVHFQVGLHEKHISTLMSSNRENLDFLLTVDFLDFKLYMAIFLPREEI